MSSTEPDWRAKYREALTRLGAEEGRARKLENVFGALIGRLCLAARGRDARLDQELARLTNATRNHSEVEQFEELIAPLSEAVAVLDAKSDAPAEGAGEDTVTRPLIERIARIERERFELEDFVQQMTARLNEIEENLAGDITERDVSQEDTTNLNLVVTGEVEQIRLDVQQASDLAMLRKELSTRLDTISAHVREFRVREATRTRSYRERTQRMRSRIATLERESRLLQENLQQEQQHALIDALTSIPNRAAYDIRIEQEFKRWKRFGRPVSILAWDIDRFKSINDAYGHKAGDKVLHAIGQQLRRHVRNTDFVGRYGGEEFVMLLVGSSPEEAKAVAEKVRAEIANLGFHFHEQPVKVTVSCGIAGFAAEDGPDSVFDRADKALYKAKKAGRNCCVVG